MKTTTKRWFFPLLLLFISITSCDSADDCSSYADSPPPFYASLKFIDAETGENLLLNGTISRDDIRLKGSENNHITKSGTTDIPPATINLNLGTEHQRAEINWEFTIKDNPTFLVNFHAIEIKTNNKCAGPRHYFFPDRESLKITDSKGLIIQPENGIYTFEV